MGREVDHRSSSHRSRHRSHSRSRDRDRERDRDRDYYSRKRRSNSRSRPSKSRKKKSKRKRYRSSSSSSTSSRSRGSPKSSSSSRRTTTRPTSSEENSMSLQAPPPPKDLHVLSNFRDRGAIEKIEDDSFAATPFVSSSDKKKISEKVLIDLRTNTILVEDKDEDKTEAEESLIFHPNFIGDEMKKMEKWLKKLYNYRQKAFQEYE